MANVSIRALHKRYGTVHAVRGIDLELKDGDFNVLVGPSGCGKSTLLRMIAGLESVSAGSIEVGGTVVNDMRPRDRDVAMVFQDYALYPHMSVANNIGFSLTARKMSRAEIEARVGRAAAMLGIGGLLDRYPRQLSGGQRQRVAIGRAIVRNPKIFLFDEPLSNLDAQLRDEMRGEIKRLHQEIGTTMIYVTHDQIEAMTLADRIVLMRDGVIEQQGGPLDLFERPRTKFVAGFLGSPQMNFIPAKLLSSGSRLLLDLGEGVRFPVPARLAPLDGQVTDVLLGVRPEHLHRAQGNSVADGHVRHAVTIELVQPTGSRTYITFALNMQPVIAEVAAQDVQRSGEQIEVDFDLNRAVLINSATGLVLASEN